MNAYADRRHVSIDISFRLIDLEAAGHTTPTVSNPGLFSHLPDMLTGDAVSPGKIITMEDDLMRTDGTWEPMPEDMQVPYWSSALSGSDGAFSTPPTLTLTLSAPASSGGFSIKFDEPAGCWPSRVRITTYNGSGGQLSRAEFEVSRPILEVTMPVDNYQKVVVAFLRTPVPYRRIKLYSFEFGVIKRFDPDTIEKATFQRGTTPDSSALPSAELTFTFDNRDKQYNMINPTGLYRFLQDGQVIETGLTIDGDRVDMGRYYFRRSEAQDDAMTAEITANDQIMDWDGQVYNGGQSGTWTLGQALNSVIGPVSFDFGPGLESYMVSKAIPEGTTVRKAVQMLCQAARCSCWIKRSGAVVCRQILPGTSKDTLDADNMESMASVRVSDRVDKVMLTIKDKYADTERLYMSGRGIKVKAISNPCVAPQNGQAVADWLLAVLSQRLTYEPINRGNPELIIGDTITIYNAYQAAESAVIIGQSLVYDGGLTAKTTALGGTVT